MAKKIYELSDEEKEKAKELLDFMSKNKNNTNSKISMDLPTANMSKPKNEMPVYDRSSSIDFPRVKIASQQETKNLKKFRESNNFTDAIDNVTGVLGNIGMGIENVIPNMTKYMNEGNKVATKKATSTIIRGVLNRATKNKEFSDKVGQIVGNTLGEKIHSSLNPIAKTNQELNNADIEKWRTNTIQNNISKTNNFLGTKLAELAPSIGNNALPMAVALAPVPGARALSTAMFMTSAGGSYLDDAKARGMNEDEAFGYATIMGTLEGGTEAVISGNMLNKGVKLASGHELSKEILGSYGLDITENFAQEAIMEPLSELTATITGGKESADWNNMGQRMINSGIDGALSAVLLSGVSAGIGSAVNVVNKHNNGQAVTQNEIKTAMKDIQNSGKINVEEVIKGSIEAIKENNNINVEQNSLPAVNKENTYSNQLKQIASNEITNSNISEDYKTMMLDVLNNMNEVSDADIGSIRQNINSLEDANRLDTKIDSKNDQARRKKYMQYKNDTNTYDSTEVNAVLDMTPTNRNGRRTVKQWLTVADEIGKRIANKSNAEIEQIAYKSWFDIEPSKSITQYDSQSKTSVAFQKFTSDEWVNTINNAVNETRKNNSLTNDITNTIAVENNKEFLTQSYQYEKSDNAKINNLREDASKYFDNSKESHAYIDMLEKIITDKDIDIRLDGELKTPDGRVVNGSYANGTITINPNSNRAGEFIAIHELTHAIGTKEMLNIVENYRKSNVEFDTSVKQLLGNYNSTEITEEALADVSAQLFGNQEFINNVANTNPSFFKKIYNEIKYLWHQFRGYKNQNEFVEDLYNKWTQAYNSNSELKNTENYHISENFSSEIDKALNNQLQSNTQVKARDYTPQILVDNGVDNLPMLITQKHIKSTIYTLQEAENLGLPTKNVNYHGLGKDLLIKAIDNLDSPQAIYKTSENNYLVVTEFKDNNGKEIVIPIQINGNGRYNNVFIDENQIKSVYGRNNLDNYINKNNFEQIYKKNEELDFNERIQYSNVANSSIKDSIAPQTKDVNTTTKYSMQESENDSQLSEKAKRELHRYVHMNKEELNKAFSDVIENKENMLEEYNRLSNEYKEYQKSEDFTIALKNSDYEGEAFTKAGKYAEKLRYYNEQYEKYKSQQEAINSLLMGNKTDTRSVKQVIKEAEKHFGITSNFKETAYIDIDGNQIDFSGKHEGGMSGSRSLDHRQINEIDVDMQSFIDMGNIRIIPEGNGINLSIEPNAKQYAKLEKYIDSVNGEIYIDIDKTNTTYDSIEYKKGTSTSKIINDLQYYFRNGKFPKRSDLAQFRYSIQKESGSWQKYLEDNFKASGTRTNMQDILVQKASNANSYTKTQENKQAQTHKSNELETSEWTKRKKEGEKRRKHYESIIRSNYTTDEAKAIAKSLMGTDTYVPESNSKQLELADDRISTTGADSELASLLSRATTGGTIKAEDIAIGERLIQYYSKTGNKTKLQDAIQATAMAGTTAGQTVQAMSLLNHQTPEGQAVWLQRSVDKMNKDLKRTRGEDAEQFKLTPEMLNKITNSENAKVLEQNLNEVYKELGQQVTKTTAQKIDAWRYFSMLANPRTHIRNIVGNTAMGGVQGIKNKVAGGIESAVSKINPDMERNHTVIPASKEVKAFAKADIENVVDRLGLNENKYNPKTRLENNMRTFKSNAMENTIGKAFDLNNKALEAEDGWGLKAGYVKALSEYMTANKLTPDTITDQQLGKARNFAIEQAKEATFHQDSQLASLINQLSNKNKFSKFVLDTTLPFKKTPINVAKAGLEYSPVGLVKSAVYDTVQLRKGNITANKYIDNISKGLTGTGIALVGYALANCGVLKATGSDDEDKEKFEEGRGSQNYAITIGNNTYSLDWLAPSGIPLFIGAECYELMKAQKEKKTSSSDEDEYYNKAIDASMNILDSFTNAMNPMTEMSMLSGLTSALKSYDQGSSKMLASIGTNSIKSYVNQFIPTALGQIAKTTDEYERNTTSTKTGVLPKAIDTTRTQIMNKIPGLRQKLPIKTDIWGQEQKQSDNIALRALENAVFPWARKELNSNNVDKEITKVYESTGESSVFPDTINKNLTIDKKKYVMTSKEFAKYKKQFGETSYELLNNLINSDGYKKLSDSQKQLAIEKVYSYSTEQVKIDYARQNCLKNEQSTLSQVTNAIRKAGGNTSNYFEFLANTQGLDKDSEKLEVLANSKYDEKTKKAIYENSLGKKDTKYNIVKESFTGSGLNMSKYLQYKAQEFKADKKDDGTVNGKSITGSKKDKVFDYIDSIKGATYTQKLILYALEYKPSSSSDREIVENYVRNLPNKTAKEKLEIMSKFAGVTVYKNNSYTY